MSHDLNVVVDSLGGGDYQRNVYIVNIHVSVKSTFLLVHRHRYSNFPQRIIFTYTDFHPYTAAHLVTDRHNFEHQLTQSTLLNTKRNIQLNVQILLNMCGFTGMQVPVLFNPKSVTHFTALRSSSKFTKPIIETNYWLKKIPGTQADRVVPDSMVDCCISICIFMLH